MKINSLRTKHWRYAAMLISISAFVLAALCVTVHAGNGSKVIHKSAKQNALCGSGAADPLDASWVTINPAGMVHLDPQLNFSWDIYSYDYLLEPDGPYANDADGDITAGKSVYMQNISLVTDLNEKNYLSLGVNIAGGQGANLSASRTTFGSMGGFDTETEFGLFNAAIDHGYKLTDTVSFSYGLVGTYSRFKTNAPNASFVMTAGNNETDESFGYGFKLGVYKTYGRFALSLYYQSRQWTQRFDKYDDVLMDSLDFPQLAIFGLAWHPNTVLSLYLDYEWINWSGIKIYSNKVSEGGYGWTQDQHVFKAGIKWTVNERAMLLLGYNYGKSPIGPEDAFAHAGGPTMIEHHAGIGFSYRIFESFVLDLSYQKMFSNSVTENGEDVPMGVGSKLTLEAEVISIGFNYEF
ncbi:MAG: hypothetical protein GY874_22650 [Desulfobacteraceae bacterium]|nr:hypothetical protein [Desulfobacteraceae bacterium]